MNEREPQCETPLSLPEDLVHEGEEWIRERIPHEMKEQFKTYLQNAYIGGLQIFETHRKEAWEQIEQNGGFERFARYYDDYCNGVYCQNGKLLAASDLLTRTYDVQTLTPDVGMSFEAQQEFAVYMSFGGTGLGIKPENALEADARDFTGPDLKTYFDQNFYPEDILVSEAILSSFDSRYGLVRDVREQHYSVSASTWNAKLRPEFGGDPDDPGRKVTDMMFTATGEVPHPRKEWKTCKGMKTFMDRYGGIQSEGEAIEKLKRFNELMSYCYQQTFGEDLYTDKSSFAPQDQLPSGMPAFTKRSEFE